MRCRFGWLGLLVAACTPADEDPADLPAPGPMNILFILTDDQRADTLACMPNVQEQLVSRGLTFTWHFASTPLCCPARASILTGLFAHNHGVQSNGDVEDGDRPGQTEGALDFRDHGDEELQFVRVLQGAGYRTGLFGKYLNGYSRSFTEGQHIPPYWDAWAAMSNDNYFDFSLVERETPSDVPERVCYLTTPATDTHRRQNCIADAERAVDDGNENYSGEIVTDRTADFIREAAADGVPFFAYFAPKSPHKPFQSTRRYQPNPDLPVLSELAEEKLASCPLLEWDGRPPSFKEDDIRDQPAWVRHGREHFDDRDADDMRRSQLGALLSVDDEVDRLLQTVDEAGLTGSTVVVFASDNGVAWGEHFWLKKDCSFDECTRVPLVVVDPRVPGARTSDWLSMNVDLAPTFADLAGVDLTGTDGVSFAPLVMATGDAPPRDAILTECWSGEGPDIHAAVRTRHWKYVEHYLGPDMVEIKTRAEGGPEVELYDMDRDPWEIENLSRRSPLDLRSRGYDPAVVDDVTGSLEKSLRGLKAQ